MQEFFDETVFQPFLETVRAIAGYLPVLLVAAAVFIVGLIAAYLLSRLGRRVFLALPIEKGAGRLGFGALAKGDIKHSVGEIVRRVVWWGVVLLFLDFCAEILGFTLMTRIFDYLILYIPRILLAGAILFVAYVAGSFLGGLARVWASKISGINAVLIGKAVRYGMLFVGAVMALEKLYLTTAFLIAVFITVFGAVMLAAAIAFGLAFADPAKGVVSRLLDRDEGEGRSRGAGGDSGKEH
ncbi:MAG: hypothetical protein PVH29_06310 [Candidatus Zixiibacteriota bacterium]|jgi:hypothetical protein